MPFDHFRVDEGDAALARHRHPVVAILDEVDSSNLIELDRRQDHVLVVGAVDALPAVGGIAAFGKKAAVEITETVDAADDLIDRHLLHTAVALPFHGDAVAHIGIGEEHIGLATKEADDIVQERLAPGTIVIGAYLIVSHGVCRLAPDQRAAGFSKSRSSFW